MERIPIVFISGSDLDTTDAFLAMADAKVGTFRALDQSTNASTTWTSADMPVFIAEKITSGNFYFDRRTPPIYSGEITKVYSKGYSAPTAQITYAGYNPVADSGTFSFNCDTTYGLKSIAYSAYTQKFYNNRGVEVTAHIKTDCCTDCDSGCGTATAYVEAEKFAVAFNEFKQYNKYVGVELVVDNAANDTCAVWTDASTAVFTYGSAIVTTSAANTLAVGDYIRIGDHTAGSTLSNTNPVYKIKTILSTTKFEMDTPWQNATVTKNLDTTLDDTDVAKVTVSGITKAGLKFTGKFLSFDNSCCCFPPFNWDFDGVWFLVVPSLTDSITPCLTSETITTTTTMSTGHGTGKQVLYEEMDYLGYTDVQEFFKDCASNVVYTLVKEADTTKNYNVWYLHFRKNIPVQSNGGVRSNADYVVKIFIETGIATTVFDTMWTSIASVAGITYEDNN